MSAIFILRGTPGKLANQIGIGMEGFRWLWKPDEEKYKTRNIPDSLKDIPLTENSVGLSFCHHQRTSFKINKNKRDYNYTFSLIVIIFR